MKGNSLLRQRLANPVSLQEALCRDKVWAGTGAAGSQLVFLCRDRALGK